MSRATGAGGPEAFAQLLRELKDRSGLSYGALAKRLHMSTSTLHRYCNGTAVPVEYGPVERFARVCRATPQELVELHRRWILADAVRGRGVERGAGSPAPESSSGSTGVSDTADAADAVGMTGAADAADTADTADTADAADAADSPHAPATVDTGSAPAHRQGGEDRPVVIEGPRAVTPPRRQARTVLITCVVAAAVVGAVVLTTLPFGGGGKDRTGAAVQETAAASTTAATGMPGSSATGKPSAERSPDVKGHGRPSPSVSGSAPGSERGGAAKGDGGQGPAGSAAGVAAVPLTVGTRPYVYDNPCSQHFLVKNEPAQVGPPATEQDAPRWAAAYGAVSSGQQRVALTVQGTDAQTVVLEALHVRILTKGAPLAWNDYAMGVGCGGGVDTESFDIALDAGSPAVTVRNGRPNFPYKVSESDPEVFYVTAHSTAYDVRWDLTLDWSSGTRHGTVHIDDNGTPFRTSADANRPGYDYPLGGGEWIPR